MKTEKISLAKNQCHIKRENRQEINHTNIEIRQM